MSTIRRIIGRSGSAPGTKGSGGTLRPQANGDALGEQLASLLGVRAAFEVEENEYMRDKFMQVSTLGLAGKRGVSESWNLAETQVGTVWKPRILMITMSSVLLFGTKKTAPASPSAGGSVAEIDATRSHAGDEGLLNKADELKTSVSMEDISYACQFTDPRGSDAAILQIRATHVTGVVRTTLVRLKSADELNRAMDVLEVAIRSYRSALDWLKEGLINENSSAHSAHGAQAYNIVAITQRDSKTGDERVVARAPEWGKELVLRGVSSRQPLLVYLSSHSHTVYCATIVPYQLEVAAARSQAATTTAEDSSPGAGRGAVAPCVRADPLPGAGSVVDDGSNASRPLSLTISVELQEETASAAPNAQAAEPSVAERASSEEQALSFELKETSIVAAVCVAVAAAMVAPDWCFSRKALLTLLAVPVALLMLAVRSRAGHKSSRAEQAPDVIEQQKQEEGRDQGAVTARIRFVTASEGLSDGVMDPSETLESYRDKYSMKSKLSALAAAGVVSSSRRNLSVADESKLEGIDALLRALEGAHETLQDSDCPQKWFDATDGNEKDAIRQWRDSLSWRRELEVDTILTRPLPKFFQIKSLFPHAWLGIDNAGHLVTLEQFGNVRKNVHDMKAAGITAEDFAYHCVFLNEYWIKNKVTQTGRLNKIVDLKGFGVSQLSKEVINFFQPMNHAMQQYPELIIKVHIINAPSSFRFAWRIVSAFLAKKTTEKISVVSGNEKTISDLLTSMIPKNILLPDYGGTMDLPFRDIPVEVDTANYIRRVNHNAGVQGPDDWDPLGLDDPRLVAKAEPVDGTAGAALTEPVAAPVVMAASAVPAKLDETAAPAPAPALAGPRADDPNVQLLMGDWVGDSERSDNMDPILELQGISWIKRKAAKMLTPNQSIQILGNSDQLQIDITTKSGPVVTKVQGIINGAPATVAEGTEGAGEVVSVRTVPPPPHFVGKSVDCCVQLDFTRENGDRRVVTHAIAQGDNDTKLMSIQYTRARDNSSALVTLVSSRRKR